MKKNLCIVLIIVITLFVSCAKRPIVRLRPVSNTSTWYLGKEVVSFEANDISVAIAFEETDREHAIFYVEIANQSGDTIMIDPNRFYFIQYQNLENLADKSLNHGDRTKFYAVDPEKYILETEKEISRENARYATGKAMDATVGFLGFIDFIAHLGERKSREEMKEEEQEKEREEKRDQEAEEWHEKKIKRLTNIKDKWKISTLRKTTLAPNQAVSGKVYFPRFIKKKYFVFHFPIDKSLAKFKFQKELFYP